MNKLTMSLCLLIVLSVAVFAQSAGEEYNENEFYVGYSNQQISREFNIDRRRSLNGIEASYVRNFHRFFGVKGDFSAGYHKGTTNGLAPLNTPIGVGNTPALNLAQINYDFSSTVYNFWGGVQVKDNASEGRFNPFAHALIGAAHQRLKTKNVRCISNCPSTPFIIPDQSSSETGFSAAFGGGLDIKINEKIDFRAVQIDYNPMFSGSRANNAFRFGIGFVFK